MTGIMWQVKEGWVGKKRGKKVGYMRKRKEVSVYGNCYDDVTSDNLMKYGANIIPLDATLPS
jgi:UDP-galactopyranose mutase